MKPLYTTKEYNKAKGIDKLPCECYQCGVSFLKTKKEIKYEHKNQRGSIKYCSFTCMGKNRNKSKIVSCVYCNKQVKRMSKDIKRSKNNFCSSSCAASYNNKHKTHGSSRSKLEIWIEEQLSDLYPHLHIDYNQNTAIGSELDIYIPSLNVAIEINGIFHYEPIYGDSHLKKVQSNDQNKLKACDKAKIDLFSIDTTQQKYFKESTSHKYRDIIINIVKERLLTS